MKHILHPVLTVLSFLALASSATGQCSFNPSTIVTPVQCFGGSNGAIDLSVSGGPIPFTYMWSNGATTQDMSNLVAGTYTVTVADAVGCTMTMSNTVIQPANLVATVTAPTLDCYNPSGSFTVNVIGGGIPPYIWLLSNDFTSSSGSAIFYPGPVTAPGAYTITITNANGCTATVVSTVNQDANPPIANAGPDKNLTCFSTTVALDASGSSIGPQFIYIWTGSGIVAGGQTINPVVNQPGVYTLLVTNAQNGCTSTDQVIVTADIVSPTITILAPIGLPCGGGIITIPISGAPGSTYNWSGPNNFSSNVQNPATSVSGDYSVTATNSSNGCTATALVTVFPGPAIPNQNFTVTNLPCTPGILGAIDMLVDFGTAPHTFLWSNAATTEDIDNLNAGTYSVTVSDATGCDYYAKVLVNQTNSNAISTTVTVTNVACFGGNTGNINLTTANGSPPYNYQWTGPMGFISTQEDPTGLISGNYSVTITDNSGCTATRTFTLTSPLAVDIPNNGTTVTSVLCSGAANGAINITPVGGTPPYTYDWSNDGPEDPDNDPQDLTGLIAGTYTVTITDAQGCAFTLIYIVSSPAPMVLTAVVTPVPCGSSGAVGAISVTASGGTSSYAYLWSNGNTTKDLANLPTGTYTVTVTDSNGCTATSSTTVFNGATIPQGDFTSTPASCQAGAMDGSITLNILPAGAQAPLTFSWQEPAGFNSTNQDISGLAAGSYSLKITDIGGCQYVATIIVGKLPGGFTVDIVPGSISCAGGTLDATATGGTGPFTYLWSDGSTAKILSVVQSGTYTVTVTDANGCSSTASSTSSVPPVITLGSSISYVGCAGGNNGTITLTVFGGTPPYTYTWTTGATTQNLIGLGAGVYCVTVTDINNCTKTSCSTVSNQNTLGATVVFTPPTCHLGVNGSITVVLFNAGAAPYSWILSGPVSQNGTTPTSAFTIPGLASGTYSLMITNAEGCSATNIIVITSPPPVIATITELSNNCNMATLSVTISGGTAPFTYSWEGPNPMPGTTPIITAPLSGFYYVIVNDANGCGDIANFTVNLANGGNCGYLTGAVVRDDNENCIGNFNEAGLANWIVRAEGLDTIYGVTNANGEYLVGVPTGTYTIAVLPPNNLWTVCPIAVPVSVNMPNDTTFAGRIPVKRAADCPALTVSIGTNLLRRCFSTNNYNVAYCNEGTADAENAYIDVTLDPFLTYINSSIPSQNLGNNMRRFYIGQIIVGDCGAFSIKVSVSCSATLGQTHCTEAHIFPDTLCLTNAQWSGASLAVRSICNTDSIRFVIKNNGIGNMTTASEYIVVEDAVMLMRAPMPLLNAGDSIIVSFPANGSTWHVEVGQEANHPYPDPTSVTVEGCTTSSSFSLGFVNQFSLPDPSPAVDIDCTANTGSFDPNDKQGYPIGYGAAHYVRPGTELTYLIRFQNTGTDTAFTVRIIDTLSTWLDPASIKFGVSSHTYRYDLCGAGIAHFIFEDIMLADSNINEAASHGFVTYTILPKADAPLGSVIENKADIYFDYNDPVVTNTTFHELGENFLSVRAWQPHVALSQVVATPNPFSDETVLEVRGLSRKDALRLQVFDLQGHEIRTMTSQDAVFHLKKSDWPAGMYIFKISQNGKLVGSGKLVAQ